MISATSNYLTALAAYHGGPLYYAVEIDGYSRIFTKKDDGLSGHYPWIRTIDDYSITVNDTEGGADEGTLSFSVIDKLGAVTADFPSFVFEGKTVLLKQGFAGLAYADYVTLFTGYVTDVISVNNNLEYQFDCSDTPPVLSRPIYTEGDDGYPTSGEHKRTLVGHPMDLIIDILETELGFTSADYNKTKLEAYRDGPFTGLRFLFRLDQAPIAIDFIKTQIMKVFGGYTTPKADGTLDFNFPYPLELATSSASFNAANWLSVPTAEIVDFINVVQYEFDKNDGGGQDVGSSDYLASSTQEYALSISRYGQYGEQQIQADGLRSTFQGFFIAAFMARLVFQRYGLKALKFDSDAAESMWSTVLVEPGDIIDATHSLVPDRLAGVVGITAKLFEVFNKTINFTEGRLTYTMLDATYLNSFGFTKIAPDGHVAYTLSTSLDKAKYMFLCNDSDQYSNGDSANKLG